MTPRQLVAMSSRANTFLVLALVLAAWAIGVAAWASAHLDTLRFYANADAIVVRYIDDYRGRPTSCAGGAQTIGGGAIVVIISDPRCRALDGQRGMGELHREPPPSAAIGFDPRMGGEECQPLADVYAWCVAEVAGFEEIVEACGSGLDADAAAALRRRIRR